ASGLREGYEFQTQVNIKTENNERFQPDVIVHLPQGKDVIIDAKMSLVAYERYFNSDDEQQQMQALQEHINSRKGHIRDLSR
ncbi:DNA recombination protein RmuC, partial [Xenorhabdus bovienii]|uniref:DNA recombination protein RmuC n=1 Tax=Xenorhabdus bovienii TaxID=40576 RepID=UPI0023B24468